MNLMEQVILLSRVNAQIQSLKHRIRSAETYHRTQVRQMEDLDGRLRELSARKKHLQTKLAALEMEAATLDERSEKFRADLNASHTNKQYSAVLTELNDVKAQRGRIDEAMIAEMEAIEQVDQEIILVTTQRDDRAKVVDLAAQRVAERKQDASSSLDDLERQRAETAAAIPAPIMQSFESSAALHDGDPLAVIEEIDRRHRVYACGGCNIDIPFQIVANLTSEAQTHLTLCPSCGRILHMHEEIRGALASPK